MEEADELSLMTDSINLGIFKKSDSCMIDSNCTSYVTSDRSAFSNYKEDAGQSVEIGTGEKAIVAGMEKRNRQWCYIQYHT